MTALELVGWWIILTLSGHACHLVAGCLSVGPAEVERQVREAYDGPLGYALFVATAGLYSGGVNEVSDAEPQS